MAITLPAMSEWMDEVANLTQLPEIGVRFLSGAPIFRAMGLPRPVSPGKLKIKWSDGGTAGTPATTAGMTYTGTVPLINDTFTLDWGVVACPASFDLGTLLSGPGFAAQSSIELAVATLYDAWVSRMVAGEHATSATATDGTDYTYWCGQDIVADEDTAIGSTVMAQSGSYSHAEFTSDKGVLIDAIDKLTAEMPSGDGSYNVCMCDSVFFRAVKKQVRDASGNTAFILSQSQLGGNFAGYDALIYDNCVFFPTHHLTQSKSESRALIYNIGPSGIAFARPSNYDMLYLDGPKAAQGALNRAYDLALIGQICPLTPRAVGQLTEIVF